MRTKFDSQDDSLDHSESEQVVHAFMAAARVHVNQASLVMRSSCNLRGAV